MEQPKLQAHALSVELLSHALCYGLSERTLLSSASIYIVRDARTCFREERLCKHPHALNCASTEPTSATIDCQHDTYVSLSPPEKSACYRNISFRALVAQLDSALDF